MFYTKKELRIIRFKKFAYGLGCFFAVTAFVLFMAVALFAL